MCDIPGGNDRLTRGGFHHQPTRTVEIRRDAPHLGSIRQENDDLRLKRSEQGPNKEPVTIGYPVSYGTNPLNYRLQKDSQEIGEDIGVVQSMSEE